LVYDRRSWALAWTCALSFVPLVFLMWALALGRNGRKQAPARCGRAQQSSLFFFDRPRRRKAAGAKVMRSMVEHLIAAQIERLKQVDVGPPYLLDILMYIKKISSRAIIIKITHTTDPTIKRDISAKGLGAMTAYYGYLSGYPQDYRQHNDCWVMYSVHGIPRRAMTRLVLCIIALRVRKQDGSH